MGECTHSAPSSHLGQLFLPGEWEGLSSWKAHLCGLSEGAHIGLLRGSGCMRQFPLLASLSREPVCRQRLSALRITKEGVGETGVGHRNVSPQGDGRKKQVLAPHQPETESWSNTVWEQGACLVRNWLGRGG